MFLDFAREVNAALDACGFPLCKGEIMARNPKWCLTLDEWRAVFAGWICSPQPAAAGNAAFRCAMVENALSARPPLGLLHDFTTDDSKAFPGTLDLKGNGARPFVDGARALALAHRLPATSTAARGLARMAARPAKTSMDKFKTFLITQQEKGVKYAYTEMALDDLDPGEVVIRVAYSDVNYKDALAATGKGRILMRPSCVGGIDLAGTVVSSTDARFAKGDAVLAVGHELGVKHHGGYAEYARIPASWAVKLPKGMTLWEAMAFGTAGYTAGLAIVKMEHNGLHPGGGPVIVDGATGGVGSIAIAALSKLGYHVVALTGKEHETDWLKKIGAKEVKLRKELDLAKIRPLDKASWQGAIDNLGGEVLAWMASTMKFNGVIASIGLAAGFGLNTTVMPFILRGVSLLGINSTDAPGPELERQIWARLGGDMKPAGLKEMARTIAFADLPKVFDDFINAKVTGRIVVDLNP